MPKESRTLPAVLALLLALPVTLSLPAPTARADLTSCDVAGPDEGGYKCEVVAYDFKDTEGGTELELGDDAVSEALALPFDFPWYGQTKTSVHVGSNGLLCFTAAQCQAPNELDVLIMPCYPITCIELVNSQPEPPDPFGPDDLVACFWEDLAPHEDGVVRTKTVGASPDRVFVVEFHEVPHWKDTYNPSTGEVEKTLFGSNTFQLQLTEGGQARCMYHDVVADADTVASIAAAENGSGHVGVRYQYDEFAAALSGARFVCTLASAPGGLEAARGPGPGEISLSWEEPADGCAPQRYRVFRGHESGNLTFLTDVQDRAFTDTGLPEGATRFYQVSAVNPAGEGPRSGEASARSPARPGAPRELAVVTGPGRGEVALSWQAPLDDGGLALTYNVYRGEASGEATFLADVGEARAFTDTGLPDGATRFYQVSAANALGEGPRGDEASASAPALPGAPRSLAAEGGIGSIALAWEAPASDGGMAVTHYRVHRSTASGGPYELLATLGDVRTFADTGLPDGATRFYKVSAVNGVGEGPRSDEASATTVTVVPPGPPRALAVAAGPGVGQLRLTWTVPESDGGSPVTGYRVYRAAAADGAYVLRASVGAVTSYTDGGLGDGATWHYRVAAVNGAGEGQRSTAASGTTFALPGPPRALEAERTLALRFDASGARLGLQLDWEPPALDGGTPVTKYRVYRGIFPSDLSLVAETTDTQHRDFDASMVRANYYRVTSVNMVGEGSGSAIACQTTYPWLPPLHPPFGGGCDR